jgi:hypothetical protein
MAVVRDTISQARFKIKPFYTVSLDSVAAFNEISHHHLFRLLKVHGYPVDLLRVIIAMCDGTLSSTQVNRFRSRPFPVRGSVRQGCTMSIILFTVALNPLLFMVDQHPEGIQWDNGTQGVPLVVHADEFTLFFWMSRRTA